MGFLDGFKQQNWRFKSAPRATGGSTPENPIAARLIHGNVASGGQVVVTPNALHWDVIDTKNTRRGLVALAGAAGVPGTGFVARRTMKRIEDTGVFDPQTIRVADINSVQTVGGPSVMRPPVVRLNMQDGRTLDFGTVASQTSPPWSRKNIAAQQSLVKQIQAALGSR